MGDKNGKYSNVNGRIKRNRDVTDINGCFLLRVRDNSIVESTIPIKINQDTLWEIPILRETFQQFSDAVSHGKLEQLTLEGDKGFIFMYNLSPDFILLTLGFLRYQSRIYNA